MTRWLAAGALLVVAGLLAGLLVVLVGILDKGVTLRVAGPIELAGEPQTQQLFVTLRLPEPLGVELRDALDVRAQGFPCPDCEEGVLIPVRWNVLSGEIVWACTGCGNAATQVEGPATE